LIVKLVQNQILQAEMTDHLGAEPGERTDERQGYRNGSYQRQLTTRVGRLELEAGFVVSGDSDLLELGSYEGIPLLPPQELLEQVGEASEE
jgi:hypothetical protein